jgi:hypothetical protein
MKAKQAKQTRANPVRKPLTFGDFVADAYDIWGSRRAAEVVRLAIKARLVAFSAMERVVIS